MQFRHLRELLEIISARIGTRAQDDAFMQSKNPLAQTWAKLHVLQADNKERAAMHLTASTITLDEYTLSQSDQAKIIRIILKNMGYTSEAISYLKHLGFTEEEMELMWKAIQKGEGFYSKTLATITKKPAEPPSEKEIKKLSTKIKNIKIAERTEDNDDFNELLGTTKNAFVSIDQEKIQKFLKVIQLPNWYEDPIFDDPEILYVTLAACRIGGKEGINSHQYSTISRWIEAKKHYGDKSISLIPLLDVNNQLTQEAKDYFMNNFVNKKFIKLGEHILMTEAQLETFRLALIKLPKTEQVLMKFNEPESGYKEDMRLFIETSDGLVPTLATGAFQAFLKTTFPGRYFHILPRLGKTNPDDIERNMRKCKRVLETYYPHPKEMTSDNPRLFHHHARKALMWLTYHDLFHALMASYAPEELHTLVFQTVDIMRQSLKQSLEIEWSSGKWNLVDYIYPQILDYVVEHTAYQDKILLKVLVDEFLKPKPKNDLKFSIEIMVLLLDIRFHPERWSDKLIEWGSLSKLLARYQHQPNLSSYYEFLHEPRFSKDDNALFAAFKAAAIFGARAEDPDIEKSDIRKLIDQINLKKDDILPRLSLKIVKSVDSYGDTDRSPRLFFNERALEYGEDIYAEVKEILAKPAPISKAKKQ